MPQLALAAAGSAIGGAIGGSFLGMSAASIGWMAGSMLGSMMFAPESHSQGPRLADLKIGQVAYGAVIPYVEGHPRVSGTIIWASAKREIAQTQSQGGKGGGGASYTSYTYEIDVYYMLAEGEIANLRRVWMNGALVWTRSDDSTPEAVEAEADLWSRLTFYSGAADQLPDPTYEAAVGTENAPAYRGRSCVFIEGMQLGSSGQLPNLTFELMPAPNAGAVTSNTALVWSVGPEADRTMLTEPPQGAYVGGSDLAVAIPVVGAVRVVDYAGSSSDVSLPSGAYMGSPAQGNADRPVVGYGAVASAPWVYIVGDGLNVSCEIPTNSDVIGRGEIRYSVRDTTIAIGSAIALGSTINGVFGSALGRVYIFNTSGVHQATIEHGAPVSSLAVTAAGVYVLSGTTLSFYQRTGWSYVGTVALPSGTGHRVFTASDGALCCVNIEEQLYRYDSGWALDVTFEATEYLGTTAAVHFSTQNVNYAALLRTLEGPDNVADSRWNWSGYNASDPDFFFYSLSEAIQQYGDWYRTTFTHASGRRATGNFDFTITSQSAFSAPYGPGSAYTIVEKAEVTLSIDRWYGYFLDVDPPGWYTTTVDTVFYRFVYQTVPTTLTYLDVYRRLSVDMVGIAEPTLQEVVERQCQRAGLSLSYVDADDLATEVVHAMAVSQITSPRQVIDMLSSAYHFTAVESEVLRFRFRGGNADASIPYDDLLAVDGEALPIQRANDLELPVQVVVRYSNIIDDYQDGSEESDRLISSGKSTALVEIPLGLYPGEAKKIADVAVQDAATSNLRFGPFSVDRSYSALEPGDVVAMEDHAGITYRVRLTKKTEAEGRLTFEGVSDDAVAVDSIARTDTSSYQNSTGVRLPIDTELLMLDIPMQTDAHDSAGLYALATPGRAGTYPGGVLLRSVDGATYDPVASLSAGVWGVTTSTLGDGPIGVFDESNTVTVNVGVGELASTTRDAIIEGTVNRAMIGSEEVQFRTATLVSAGVYQLSGLLRGLQGTEWATAMHATGEPFALLSGAVRVGLETAEIGAARYYKGVTVGRNASTAIAQAITCEGVSLMPYAPVDVRRDLSAAGLSLTWDRRTRLSSNWLVGILPLGEETEAYEVDVLDTDGVVVATAAVTQPSAVLAADGELLTLVESATIAVPLWGIVSIAGEMVGVRDDVTGDVSFTGERKLVRLASDGTQIDVSDLLGAEAYQWVNDGDALYIATADFNTGPPVTYANSKVQKLTRTSLDTVDATYTAGTPGDIRGIAFDGTSIWITEKISGNLRKLNATTLASEDSFALNAGITALQHLDGALWVLDQDASELVQWDIATEAEVLRFPVVAGAFDMLLVGDLVFVVGDAAVGVYGLSGALLAEHDVAPVQKLPQRQMCQFGDYIVVVDALGVLLLIEAATGDFVVRLEPAFSLLPAGSVHFASGAQGSTLYLTAYESGSSAEPAGFTAELVDLSGYTARVYQISSRVGRGYPAELEL